MIPSTQMRLTEERLQKYKIAMNILHLHPYDPDEDESMWEDRPKLTYDCDWSGDNDSEGSDSDNDISDNAQKDDQGTAEGASSGVNTGTEEESREGNRQKDGGKESHNHGLETKVDRVALEPTAKKTEKDPEKGAGQKAERWPQLMILGCGQLEAGECECNYW